MWKNQKLLTPTYHVNQRTIYGPRLQSQLSKGALNLLQSIVSASWIPFSASVVGTINMCDVYNIKIKIRTCHTLTNPLRAAFYWNCVQAGVTEKNNIFTVSNDIGNKPTIWTLNLNQWAYHEWRQRYDTTVWIWKSRHKINKSAFEQ